MSKDHQSPEGNPEDASGMSVNEKKDFVSYESYQKAVKESKNAKARYAELEAEKQKLLEEKMASEGKKDELLSITKKRLEELESKLEKTTKTYAWNTLTSEIKRKASALGCKDPDKLIRLMDDDDLRTIEVGEDFSIDHESLDKVLEKHKKESYFMFENQVKQAAIGIPSSKPVEEKKLKDMSLDELRNAYKKTYKR